MSQVHPINGAGAQDVLLGSNIRLSRGRKAILAELAKHGGKVQELDELAAAGGGATRCVALLQEMRKQALVKFVETSGNAAGHHRNISRISLTPLGRAALARAGEWELIQGVADEIMAEAVPATEVLMVFELHPTQEPPGATSEPPGNQDPPESRWPLLAALYARTDAIERAEAVAATLLAHRSSLADVDPTAAGLLNDRAQEVLNDAKPLTDLEREYITFATAMVEPATEGNS